jgi:ferric hydroxamate transport system substrate-binding protein
VEDIGTRQEPSIERIQALEPDLILGVDFRHAAVRDQLEAIAPTYLVSPYGEDAGSQLEGMRQTFEDVGSLAGHEEEATEVLDELDAHLDDAAAELDDAGLAGQEIAVAQGFTTDGAATVRMFSSNALVIELLDRIGLPNGWPGEPTEYGFDTVDVEGLTRLGDVELFTIAQDDDDIFATAFSGNPIWEGLPTVQRDAVHPLGGNTWTFGGPESAMTFVDRVVDALVA